MYTFKMINEKFAPLATDNVLMAIQTCGTSEIFTRHAALEEEEIVIRHDTSDFNTINRAFSGRHGFDQGMPCLFVHNRDSKYVASVEKYFKENNMGELGDLFLYDPYFVAVMKDHSLIFGAFSTGNFIVNPTVVVTFTAAEFKTMMPVLNTRRGLILTNARVWHPVNRSRDRDEYYRQEDLSDDGLIIDIKHETVKRFKGFTIKLYSFYKSDKEIAESIIDMDEKTKEWADKNVYYWKIESLVRLGSPFGSWNYPVISGFKGIDPYLLEMFRSREVRRSTRVIADDGYLTIEGGGESGWIDNRIAPVIKIEVVPGLEIAAASSLISNNNYGNWRVFYE